jgi:hypothetical protein
MLSNEKYIPLQKGTKKSQSVWLALGWDEWYEADG